MKHRQECDASSGLSCHIEDCGCYCHQEQYQEKYSRNDGRLAECSMNKCPCHHEKHCSCKCHKSIPTLATKGNEK